MTNSPDTAQRPAQPVVATGPLVRHSFPKIPERDEHGDACLYPGASKFEGAAALYNTEHGEVVILAPNIEALEAQARKFGIADRLFHRDRCIITEARRVPNTQAEPRAQRE